MIGQGANLPIGKLPPLSAVLEVIGQRRSQRRFGLFRRCFRRGRRRRRLTLTGFGMCDLIIQRGGG